MASFIYGTIFGRILKTLKKRKKILGMEFYLLFFVVFLPRILLSNVTITLAFSLWLGWIKMNSILQYIFW